MPILLPTGDTLSITQYQNAFDASRITGLIDALAEYGRTKEKGISRVAFSSADQDARQHYCKVIGQELNATLRIDAMGNIIARRQGSHPHWPALITGSHLDTVPNGGAYDGTAGVAAGVEAFRVLDKLSIETHHPLELIVFAAEEPNPFGFSTFGSRGMSGKLDQAMLDNSRSPSGRTLEEAVNGIGGDIHKIMGSVRDPDSVAAFVELHIEQMPNLEAEAKKIGIVSQITGLQRYRITLQGEPDHAGTTLMTNRKDALCGAAELTLAVETAARKEPPPTVATVGRLNLSPNATNVVPQQACMEVEIRSCDPQGMQRVVQAIEDCTDKIMQERGLAVGMDALYTVPPQQFSPVVQDAIGAAAAALGLSTSASVSMAGHDAASLATLAESGMIFIPCRKGRSHCPEEWVDRQDLLWGSQCLLLTLLNLDRMGEQRQTGTSASITSTP